MTKRHAPDFHIPRTLSYERDDDRTVAAAFAELDSERLVVLLGEPNSGKTTEFQHEVERLRNEGKEAFLAHLPLLRTTSGIASMFDPAEKAGWEKCLGAAMPIYLYCDSLDEGRFEAEDIHRELAGAIDGFPGKQRLHVRISCRSRDWRDSAANHLQNALGWGSNSVTTRVARLQPIDDEAAHNAAREFLGEDRAAAFLREVERQGVLALCANAGLLRLMLLRFDEKNEVGRNKTDIYEDAVERLLDESNKAHQEHIEYSRPQRREAAQKLALGVLLGGRDVIVPGAGSENELDGGEMVAEMKLLKETLNSGLFADGKRFFHRSFAEYLAARALAEQIENHGAWRRIKPLMVTIHGIPTPLRGLAGWLSQCSRIAFDELFRSDPLVVLEGDASALNPVQQRKVALELAERYAGRDFQNEIREFPLFGQSLDRETLLDLLSPARSLAVRSMAMEWVESARRADCFDELLALALDEAGIPALRYAAAKIIAQFGDASQKDMLKKLLTMPNAGGPEGELTGIVLGNMFPERITLEEALCVLHFPRAENLIGYYRWFWTREFEQRIADKELPLVLDCLAALVSEENDHRYSHREFSELYLRLLGRYLASSEELDMPRLYRWFQRFREVSRELRRDDPGNAAIRQWLEQHNAARRGLVALAVEAYEKESREQFSAFGDLPFDLDKFATGDVEWLLADCRGCGSERARLAYFDTAFWVWRWNDFRFPAWFDGFEAIAAASPACAERWRCELEPVEYLDHWQHTDRVDSAARKNADAELQRKNRDALLAGLDKIRGDVGNYLSHCVEIIWPSLGRQNDEEPMLRAIEEKFASPEITAAVKDGLLRAWATPHVATFEEILPQGNQVDIPYSLIKADLGMRLAMQRGTVDWKDTAPEQRRAALIAALMIWLNALPDWFEPLYRAAPSEIEGHLYRVLSIESARLQAYPRFAPQLTRFEPLRGEFAALASEFVEREGWPDHPQVFSALLDAAVWDASPLWPERFDTFARERLAQLGSTPAADQRVVEFIAAWCRVNWDGAWAFARKNLFPTMRSQRQKEWFRALFLFLPGGRFQESWTGFPFEALAQIYPLAARVVTPTRPDLDGVVSREGRLYDLQGSLKRQLAAGDAATAEPWFRKWAADPTLKHDHDWLHDVLAGIARHKAERFWSPVSSRQMMSAIFENGYLIRSQRDLFELACDMAGNRLREVLRSDFSPLTLLWQGTKKAGRKALGESALQTLIYNQLLLLFKGYRLIGAREPEVYDAKKPDFRLSVALDDGTAIHLPVEIKKDDNAGVWQAAELQLVKKYMRAEASNFGILIVGWFCSSKRHDGVKYGSPVELEQGLQAEIDTYLVSEGRGLKIAVIVLNCRLLDEK